ncbi:hypothetical protein HKCCE3408_08830 [Rhodobacterales bacterium HKCCE3408]|nr:hypothetical protein [Rhodobacterales bacterium HKCCE3408]
MKRGGALAILVAAVLAAPAQSGPWAREPGDVFLSYVLSAEDSRSALVTGSFDPALYHSLYGELGLGHRLTLGLDAGFDDETLMAQGFLRYTLTRPTRPFQFALDAGIGLRDGPAQGSFPVLRAGISVGYGFGGGATDWVPFVDLDGGWLALDATYITAPDRDWEVWQTEATLGLNVTDRITGLLQLKAEDWPGSEPAVSLRPSLLFRFGEDGTTRLQIGGRVSLSGGDEMGLRIGLWQEF